eukprot:933205-Amphidinium_carterae.1
MAARPKGHTIVPDGCAPGSRDAKGNRYKDSKRVKIDDIAVPVLLKEDNPSYSQSLDFKFPRDCPLQSPPRIALSFCKSLWARTTNESQY